MVADHLATICMVSKGNETTKQMGERDGEYLVAVVGVWAVEELNSGV